VRGPTPRRLWKYVVQRLRLQAYFRAPGDRRVRPQIPAQALLWGLVIGQVLRECAFHGVEALVRSRARRALGVSAAFGDDALAYFTERLDPTPTRVALARVVGQAKRNKAFAVSAFIGLAVDGTMAGHSRVEACPLCWPISNAHAPAEIVGYRHRLVLLSVVGSGLALPVDVEACARGEGETTVGQRLLGRAVALVGARFADYVVVDADFAKAPFLHAVGALGLRVVVRLKDNLPQLQEAAHDRFEGQRPHATFEEGRDRIEVWDADDFDPWEALRWTTVRVLHYRQHKPDGKVIEASWLTDFPPHLVDSRTLYRMAKARWEIENEGFNDAKTRHGLEHICHHDATSLLISWLLTIFALVIERLYRLRYLHRGPHRVRTAIELVRLLRLALSQPLTADTS
jgi:hypothetical protein